MNPKILKFIITLLDTVLIIGGAVLIGHETTPKIGIGIGFLATAIYKY